MGHGMERSLGLVPVIAVSIGAMLGSGIFVLPGLAAVMTGPSVPLAYLLAAVCVLPAAFSKAELATAMPTSGGTYVYISRAFGPWAGSISGLGLWLSLLFKSSFALVGLSAYLKFVAQELNPGSDLDLISVSLGILCGVTALNIFGVRAVSRIQMFVVGAALIFLLVLAGAGATQDGVNQGVKFLTNGPLGLLEAAALVSVSFAGVTKVAAIAEEVRNPGRNLPFAILLSLFLVTIIYVLVVWVFVAHIDLASLESMDKTQQTPMVDLSRVVFGGLGGLVAGVLGVLTMTSMANSGILASSRFPFAMSRDDLLPSFFQRIHPRLLTPHTCIVATGGAMAFAILFLDVVSLAKLASAFKILLFMVVNAAVLVFRRNPPEWYQPEFRSPFYPWIQILGILVGLVLISRLGMLALNGAVGISLAGTLLYFLYARPRIRARAAEKLSGRDSVVVDLVELPPVVEEAHVHQASSLTLLLGHEHTPEKLVELGAALADGGQHEVVHMMEVPAQTDLDALHDDGPEFEALQRRVERVAEEWNLDVELDGLVTHDIDASVPHIIEEVGCSWAIIKWPGPAHHNFMQTDKHWSILDHAKCNLALYRDDGVQEIRSILVFAEPDLYDELLVKAADSVAQLFKAEMTFVRCVPEGLDPVLELARVDYMDQLRALCRTEAGSRVVYGANPIDAVASITKEYDLLIMATDRPRPFANFMRKSAKDHLTEDAHCSVLRLKPQDQIVQELPFDPAEDARLSLVNVLDHEIVDVGSSILDKGQLFNKVAKDFGARLNLPAKEIEEAFWDHENEHNTGVGDGAALPHATIDGLEHETMGVIILEQAIDYQAMDGRKCDVIIAILSSPEERHAHLVLQRQLSRFVMEADLIPQLRSCSSASEVVQVFEKSDQSLGLVATEK